MSLTVRTLSPAFSADTTAYTVAVPFYASQVQLVPTANAAGARIEVDGVEVASGTASAPVPVGSGVRMVTVDGDGLPDSTFLALVWPSPLVKR